jgi:hypothetical protein
MVGACFIFTGGSVFYVLRQTSHPSHKFPNLSECRWMVPGLYDPMED